MRMEGRVFGFSFAAEETRAISSEAGATLVAAGVGRGWAARHAGAAFPRYGSAVPRTVEPFHSGGGASGGGPPRRRPSGSGARWAGRHAGAAFPRYGSAVPPTVEPFHSGGGAIG